MPYVKGQGYVRSTRTKEELSALRSQAARSGIAKRKAVGYGNVGRKKGWTKNPELKGVPSRTLTVRDPDYKVIVRCAAEDRVSIVDFMHLLAESLKRRNPELFPPVQL